MDDVNDDESSVGDGASEALRLLTCNWGHWVCVLERRREREREREMYLCLYMHVYIYIWSHPPQDRPRA